MHLKVLESKIIDYPSGSALEFYNDEFFVVGDDINYILCLDKAFKETRKIKLFEFDGVRIPKADKPDLECATILNNVLYIFGSGSKLPQRSFAFSVHLQDNTIEKKSMLDFFNQVAKNKNIQEINIEGLANLKNHLLFFNRGNTQQPNHLILTSIDILENKSNKILQIIPIEIGKLKGIDLGISGACIDEKNDVLFITASAENTDNAYDDGDILGSVIGIVPNISQKINDTSLKIEQIIKLEEIDSAFIKQKIEAICITQQIGNSYQCSLVADNDDGQSVLFNIELTI